MPANSTASDKILDFQLGFILNGGIPMLLKMLSSSKFLNAADIPTQTYFPNSSLFSLACAFNSLIGYLRCIHDIRSAYLGILRLAKVVLAIVSHLCWGDLLEPLDPPVLQQQRGAVLGIVAIADYFVRAVASQPDRFQCRPGVWRYDAGRRDRSLVDPPRVD